MEPLAFIPPEIWETIFSFTQTKPENLAGVSSALDAIVRKSVASLFEKYAKTKNLKPYTDIARQLQTVTPKGRKQDQFLEIQKVKFVFQEIMKKAQEMGFKENELTEAELQNISTILQILSPTHLRDVVKWMEAKNLYLFASKIPEMKAFLSTKEHLPLLEQAKEIRKWMRKNEESLKKITVLKLDGINLTALPKEIKYFTGLTDLNLYNNKLATLPSEIEYLTQLKRLYLNKNKLTSLPGSIKGLTQLQILYLNNNELTYLPREIGFLTQLKDLHLFHNKLTALPNEIGYLTQLRTLFLFENELTIIPSEIRFLTLLQQLQLSDNQLEAIPREIGSLTQLQQLSIDHNNVRMIPEEIKFLIGLKLLDLKNNQLEIIPNGVASLSRLQELNLSENKITDFPKTIGQLVHKGKGKFRTR